MAVQLIRSIHSELPDLPRYQSSSRYLDMQSLQKLGTRRRHHLGYSLTEETGKFQQAVLYLEAMVQRAIDIMPHHMIDISSTR